MKRAHPIPLLPGGPFDLTMIRRVYKGMRAHRPGRHALAIAVRQAWQTWRFLRAEQRLGVRP